MYPTAKLRIMTYNVHSCIGSDGIVSPYRIADIIAHYEPDVVALQELDANKSRTNHIHQAREIADYLEMNFHFHPSMEVEDEKYGIAVLSRYPLKLMRAGALPTFKWMRYLEARGALWACVDFNGRAIQIINTHLGLHWREKRLQVSALLGSEWTAHANCRPPVIMCGDMNALPCSSGYRRITKFLRDAQVALKGTKPLSTFPSRYPIARIDHIFTSPEFKVRSVDVPRTHLTSAASDHLPLIAEVSII
ncbi:MAG: endonuclease/exonuclease/phosphatase family protein [Deltaproteobacteria bacterium]|nr:endonuclease/exonuclease/phosphatase family protein [Deltaproteobacteria bacterium]